MLQHRTEICEDDWTDYEASGVRRRLVSCGFAQLESHSSSLMMFVFVANLRVGPGKVRGYKSAQGIMGNIVLWFVYKMKAYQYFIKVTKFDLPTACRFSRAEGRTSL